ncbi:MAG TPA: cytochrome c oxidase assembly protein [Rhodospirillales bacterium]|jgi:cytochrome c oxidase assembly protein subunit 11|nr:cytochrome c oxidase assembly protein [Rhodospirillales bacterium]
MHKPRKNNKATALVLFSVAGGMVGLAFAAVPLYQLFCQVTGFGGTPKVAAAAPSESASKGGAVAAREITVRFDANVNPALPWRFAPEQKKILVRAGAQTEINYRASNLSNRTTTGTATYNVTPFKAGEYFSKIECFCFTEQRLKPGEEAVMGVQFYVDPEIFTDPNTRDVKVITLSYTFFPAQNRNKNGDDGDDGGKNAKQVKALAPTKAPPPS